MEIRGRRVHIAGSAGPDTSVDLLRYAHGLIATITRELAERGATFVLGVGREPRAADGTGAPAVTFDWTALETLGALVGAGAVPADGDQGRLVGVVASTKTEEQVPADRRALWEELKKAGAIQLEFIDVGWTSGAIRRARQAQLGDVLIALSGGEGVEHLAGLYAQAGKPVIALDLDIGSSTDDAAGGAAALAKRTLAAPGEYVRLVDPTAAGVLLSDLSTRNGTRPPVEVAGAVIRLVEALAPPTAFYVRLLDPGDTANYEAVEQYFRAVVDPVVGRFGYEPDQMGLGRTEHAWMNQAIVDRLHRAAAVVVDITGLRNNCFFEMGYAFGHAQRVIVTAEKGTRPPFDTMMIEYCPWTRDAPDEQRRAELADYWRRNINRPRLVARRKLA